MIFEVLKSLGFPLAFFALSNTFLKGVLPFSKGFRLELASKRGTFLAWNSEIFGKFSQKPAKNTDLALAMSTKLDFLFYLVCKVVLVHFEVKWKLLGQIRAVFAMSRLAYMDLPRIQLGHRTTGRRIAAPQLNPHCHRGMSINCWTKFSTSTYG